MGNDTNAIRAVTHESAMISFTLAELAAMMSASLGQPHNVADADAAYAKMDLAASRIERKAEIRAEMQAEEDEAAGILRLDTYACGCFRLAGDPPSAWCGEPAHHPNARGASEVRS